MSNGFALLIFYLGLAEIQYGVTWYNLNEDETVLYAAIGSNTEAKSVPLVDVSPPPGHYESPEILVKQINRNLATIDNVEEGASIRFSYNEIAKKISIELKAAKKHRINGLFTITMSKQLAQLLGFEWVTSDEYFAWRNTIGSKTDLSSEQKEIAKTTLDGRFVEKRKGSNLLELTPVRTLYTGSNVCDLNRGMYASLTIYVQYKV